MNIKTATKLPILSLLILSFFILSGCVESVSNPTGKTKVVTTTTILGDVIQEIGGDGIELVVLFSANIDPHSYQPTPRDLAQISEADVVFINGLGLEESLESIIENAVQDAPIMEVSAGIEMLLNSSEEHQGANPHVWMDPANVVVWADNIANILSDLDPENQPVYLENAANYIQELNSLDSWIDDQIKGLALENRKIVTDHDTFAYFIHRYNFKLVGTISPGSSTLSEPSAQNMANLEDQIMNLGVPVIFVGTNVNSNLAARIVEDTGTQLISLFTGSLSEEGGAASTYIEMMRYNVNAIVDGLK